MPLYGLFIVVFGHVLLPYPFWAGALPAKGGVSRLTHIIESIFGLVLVLVVVVVVVVVDVTLFCAAGVARDFLHLLCAPSAPSSTPFSHACVSASACPNNSHNLFIASPGKTN